MTAERNPWPALGALIAGFSLIVLDMTVVAVANPVVMEELEAGVSEVIWVTSAYLLAYAAPLLFTGRLGDRFGPKNVYLSGLVVFTLASLWCGMADSIDMLIAARVVQGLGAALMTPQTMAMITQIFPADKRGAAMGVWGGSAGVSMLLGPVVGGLLVDSAGWEWIFLINVPIGVLAFALAWRLLPTLPTRSQTLDPLGILLSCAGMFLLVYGLQEGNSKDWSAGIWSVIAAGLLVLTLFVVTQARNTREPLLLLSLFRDRNFTLANIGIAAMGAAVTAMTVPSYFYLQGVRGLSSMESALIFAPLAILTGAFSPIIGKKSDKAHPRTFTTIGFVLFAVTIVAYSVLMADPDSPLWMFSATAALTGIGNGMAWGPLGAIATRNLPVHQAGAGSGVYNTNRQLGAVLGSAGVGALFANRIETHLPQLAGSGAHLEGSASAVPSVVHEPYSTALSETGLLPVLFLVLGALACSLFLRFPPPEPEGNSANAAPHKVEDAV
ncbi:DHA2 family efflux MFS transporter permease subunit [Streptomyces zagrosensis]|uniref:EmrB/QacA subfamily drug resistance transporter n=1 Tax=Streptomyces zagrosensis TaxID=1042984 RepID=A0A7W9QCL0_9ACTN|nr:DHA2 family efflux MFS transporter permease subunit [Streptomyces zagrosensis]MBB5937715.1 EmrB/QacA subfamily drug resistance transporter [Streptomyces zagrosensis]